MNISTINADLHSHSNHSDGTLLPEQVVERAHQQGVTLMALTDHDELRGVYAAKARAEELGIAFVTGLEISVTWQSTTLHILGLRVQLDCEELQSGIKKIRLDRVARAKEISSSLDRLGIEGAYEEVSNLVTHKDLIARPHFARLLVRRKICSSFKEAFQRYLGIGRPAYIPHTWASLQEAIDWIRLAGGVAVLAHPGRYKLDSQKRNLLLSFFCSLGGEGIEVVSGTHTTAECQIFAALAYKFGLKGSRGSDFHEIGGPVELGRMPNLPDFVSPVWENWNIPGHKKI